MRGFSWFVCAIVLFSSCSQKQEEVDIFINKKSCENASSYYVEIPITHFSSIQSPCFHLDWEDKTIPVELDLGFSGDLTCPSSLIDCIQSKTPIGIENRYGIRGKKYATNMYVIPHIKIGSVLFLNLTLQSEDKAFLKDSVFVKNGEEPSSKDPGRAGWKLFYNSNLMLDVPHSKMAFADRLETLQTHGYEISEFIQMPLHIERGFIEFYAVTPEGPLRCILDSGSTWNLLNHHKKEQSLDQAIWDAENEVNSPSFKLLDQECGPIVFHQVPIEFPIHIEAILGMDFLRNHVVFLQFSEEKIYVSKREKHRIQED